MATITQAAEIYQGSGYTYGGPGWPPGNWDCSSFVSEVLGRQLGLTLPGGGRWGSPGYPPNAHGPDVLEYNSWLGSVPVPGTPAPGDLVIWAGAGPNGHIGIVLGTDRMISALNPNYGTAETPIQGYGPAGLSPVYRRVTGAAGGTGTGGGTGVSVVSLWSDVFPGINVKDMALAGAAVVAILLAATAVTVLGALAVTAGAGYIMSRAAR